MHADKLMLIDGNSILNRAFYGLQGPQLLSTSDGLYTNGVYGFLNVLFKYLEEEQPQYICVAFDMKAPTFRHEQYDGYKAKRKGMPDELAVQVPVIKEVLDAMNITRVEYEGYEADDIIGWLSLCGEKKGMEVVIVTGDRDSLQLISGSTRVKLPTTRYNKTQTEEYDYNTFLDKYKIRPEQLIDVKALMGDASDNIPGVKGIGEKTALDLIRKFGSIEELYNNIDQVERKSIREKLEAEKELAFLSKKLATIERSMPEELCSIEQLKIREYNNKRLYEVFKRLEFKSLIDKLELQKKIYESAENKQENRQNSNRVIYVKELDELKNLKNLIISQKEISFFHLLDKDMPGQNTTLAGNLAGVALSWGGEDSAYIEIGKGISERDFIWEFKDVFENESIKKYGHNVKSFLVYLKCVNVNIKGLAFDTMIGAYILNPSKDTYLVSELSVEYLKTDVMPVEGLSGKGKSHVCYRDIPCEDVIPVATGYSQAIYKLQKILDQLIKANQQEILYYSIELPLIHVLADMEYYGFKVNKDELIALSKELDEKIESLGREIYNLAGEEFNINSTKQLGEVLFEKLKLPVKKKTKTGYSTDAEVLEQLIREHEIISYILEYRQLMKLKTTYADGLISMINPETGKIHTKFNQTVVVTGRISSTEPNLQNIPVKLEMGRKIRKVFEPSDENYILTDADYSQIELRVLAHISGDENLIAAFMNNEDIHTSTASKIFGIPKDKVTPLMRDRAKAVNFGIIYGIGDFSLAKDLGITRKEARKYIDDYLGKYPGVRQYMRDIITAGKEQGYVTTIFNRRRYLPELTSNNFNIRSFGERIALNTPIQGSAADIIKVAMVKIYNKLKSNNMKSRLILQVHDELIIETHIDEKNEVIKILKECMETAVTLRVPLMVDIKIGKNWYEVK
ncbi:MAG: DNA polymerase I [Firmicutes bacterium]|nr:DNA polymerase I [Bacillota bacterium]